jgi:hypothetical protein
MGFIIFITFGFAGSFAMMWGFQNAAMGFPPPEHHPVEYYK